MQDTYDSDALPINSLPHFQYLSCTLILSHVSHITIKPTQTTYFYYYFLHYSIHGLSWHM